jgi:hypothetical protein
LFASRFSSSRSASDSVRKRGSDRAARVSGGSGQELSDDSLGSNEIDTELMQYRRSVGVSWPSPAKTCPRWLWQAAQHLLAVLTPHVVRTLDHRVPGQRGEERRPATLGVELALAAEQLRLAGPTPVDTGGRGVQVFAGERGLGVRLAQHPVLLRAQPGAPFVIGLDHLRGGVGDWFHHIYISAFE